MSKFSESLNTELEVQAGAKGRYEYIVHLEGFGIAHKIEILVARDFSGGWYWELLKKDCAFRISTPNPIMEKWEDFQFRSMIVEGSTRCDRRWEPTKRESVDIMLKELKRVHCAVAFSIFN